MTGPRSATDHADAELLVVGWSSLVEGRLAGLDLPHTTVVPAAKYPRAVELLGADRVVVCSTPTDVDSLVGAVRRSGIAARDPVVFCLDEYALLAASTMAAGLGLRSALGVEQAVRFRHKDLQKDVVRRAGIRTARTRVVTAGSARRAVAELGLPAVVKPVAGAATQDTFVVRTAGELDERVDRLAARLGPVLVEEFVDGAEYHLDGCVEDGVVTALAVSRYLDNLIGIADGAIVGSCLLDPPAHVGFYDLAGDLATRVLAALGLHRGVFHLEVFRAADGLVFSECAARVGGGAVVQTVEAKLGVNLVDQAALLAAGRPARPVVTTRGTAGFTALRAPSGTVVSVPTTDELLGQPDVVFGRVDIAPGSRAPDMAAASTAQAGVVTVLTADETSCETRLRELQRWFGAAVVTAA